MLWGGTRKLAAGHHPCYKAGGDPSEYWRPSCPLHTLPYQVPWWRGSKESCSKSLLLASTSPKQCFGHRYPFYHKYWAYKLLPFCQAAVSTALFLLCQEPGLSHHVNKGEENGSCSAELMRMPTLIWKQPCLWEVKFLPYKLFWVSNRSGIIIYKNNKIIFSIWQHAFPNRLSCEAGTDSWDSVLLTNSISSHNRTAGVTQQQTLTAYLQLLSGGGEGLDGSPATCGRPPLLSK